MARVAGVHQPPKPKRARPFAVAVAVTLVLMAVSAAVAIGWRGQLQGEGRNEFGVQATEAELLVRTQLQTTRDLLEATRTSVSDGTDVEAKQFEDTVAAALPDSLPSLATVTLVEQVPVDGIQALEEARRQDGLPDFAVQSVDEVGRPPAIATFEASNRSGAAILSGYDLREVPALANALRPDLGRTVRITPLLDPLPAEVLDVHPDLGRSGFAMVAPAGDGTWVVAVMSGDELAAEAAAVDPELDVALEVDGLVGASTDPGGAAVDLGAVDSEARMRSTIAFEGGPMYITVADVDGLAGGGWREPGLLLGAGMALSILFGSLILVLARGRAGALAVASAAQLARDRSEQNFRAVVQHLSDLVMVTDGDLEITFVTPSVGALLGRDAAGLPGRTVSDLVHPADRALLASLASRSGVSETGLVRFGHSDGSDRSFEVVVTNRLEDPAIGGLVFTAHDVTDRVKLENRLSHDATHDVLTGLPNRALIRDRLQHALIRAERTGSRVAVVWGDLDGFKAVNDLHGHLVGDQLLVEVARRLRGAARAMDTVGRWSGDEFIVICEELEDERGARLVAERLLGEVVLPVDHGRTYIDVAMSLGVALAEPGEGADSVLNRADQAMYVAKSSQNITFAA
jgi:diguanylate cyclase (GGDEF)-like protein/PAS domain S-box-containing protein